MAETQVKQAPRPRKPRAPRKSASIRPYLFAAIIARNKHNDLVTMLYRQGVFVNTVVMGQGTASSEIMDILGLEDSEKDVVISLTDTGTARAVMAMLNDRLAGSVGSKGIAFTCPLTAAPNILVKAMEVKAKPVKEDQKMTDDKYSLILISVNQNYTDEVMATAKKAGARGGTLIRARQLANEEADGLFADDFSEREIIAIIAANDKRADIMNAVNAEHGMREKAGAVVLSLPVEDIAKLS